MPLESPHMYPKIIALIDEQLDRLTRARTLLADVAASPAIPELEALAKPAQEAEPVTVTRVRSSTRTAGATHGADGAQRPGRVGPGRRISLRGAADAGIPSGSASAGSGRRRRNARRAD